MVFAYIVSNQPLALSYGREANNTSNSTKLSATEFKTHKDENFGFEILYPSEWTVTTKGLKKSLVLFSSPDHEVAVILGTLPRINHETLKEFGDRYFKNRDNVVISEYYRNPNTTLAGFPAIKMIGTIYRDASLFRDARSDHILYKDSLLEDRNLIFETLYVSSDRSAFYQYRNIAERMHDSIKITDKVPIFQEQD